MDNVVDDLSKTKNKKSINSFFAKFNFSNKLKIVFVSILSLIVLAIFSTSIFSNDNDNGSTIKNEIVTATSYSENIETRLENVLSKLSGVSFVEVFIYVTQSEEVVYLTDKDTTKTSTNGDSVKETTVFNKDGSSSSAVVVVTKYPKIEGVLIVAGGAADVKLKLKIIDAVSCILCIAQTNIEVLEGKS